MLATLYISKELNFFSRYLNEKQLHNQDNDCSYMQTIQKPHQCILLFV